MLRIPSTSLSSHPPAPSPHLSHHHPAPAGPDPNMVFSYQYQATLSNLLGDYLVDLCREYLPYSPSLEIDGVVCLSDGKDLNRQIVLKVHKNLAPLPQGKVQPWPLQRRDSLEQDSDSRKWPRRADLPPKEQIPPNWQSLLGKSGSSTQSWPINIEKLKNSASGMGSLQKQGSLYGADAPQDLSLKEPSKATSASITPLSALANSVEKTPFGTYSGPNSKPAALQPINKNTPQATAIPQPKGVVSLLYQKIMEGPKGSSVPMWKSNNNNNNNNERPKMSPQNLSSEASESQQSPKSDGLKEEMKDEEDDDPTMHTGEMLCKICSETVFGGFYALQNHTYEVHRRYVCKKCYSTFSLRCNLRRHERLHEGLKPYSCDSCDKTFSRSTDLRMHMQKHGGAAKTAETVISCDKCTKSFTNVQNLRWHMYKVHKSQEELWACTICEQLFNDKDEYHQHRESHTASLNQHASKKARMEFEDSGFDQSQDGLRDDESAMRDEYQQELKAIDDEASQIREADDSNAEMSNHSGEDGGKNNRPNSNPTFSAIKQALANRQPPTQLSGMHNSPSSNGSSSRNKRKRKGNPIKHIVNGSESEEEVYDLTIAKSAMETMQVENVNAAAASSPVPSTGSDMDPLQQSYNSDVLASSSMSSLSRISEQEPTDHLQSLHAMSQIRSPLVIEPLADHSSPLSLPKTSELLYSPHCNSPLGQSPVPTFINNNNNVEDLSMSGKLTPEYKYDPDSPTPLPPVDDGDDDKEYTCTYDGCGELLQGFRAYENHFVSIHSRYPCKLCKQTFSGKNNRTRHMRNHNRAKIYPCPDCGKYFSRPDSMREHRFIHTASYQEDKCRRCGQEFQRKSLLLAHLKNCFRSARTKNGSIDESPYMDKADGNVGGMKPEPLKMEPLGTSLFENSPKSLEHMPIKSVVSLGQVDISNLSGSEMTKIASVPLNIPKVPFLNENNNEAVPQKVLELGDGPVDGVEDLRKPQDTSDMPENLSTKMVVEDDCTENEADTSGGNLVIDTGNNDVTQELMA